MAIALKLSLSDDTVTQIGIIKESYKMGILIRWWLSCIENADLVTFSTWIEIRRLPRNPLDR